MRSTRRRPAPDRLAFRTPNEELANFLYAQVLELARARGRLSHFEKYGLRFQAQVRRGTPGADEQLRPEGREVGKAWLAQHDPDRIVEVTSKLVSLARELVRMVRYGNVPDYLLTSVYRDLLRDAQLWEGTEGFRPEWKSVSSRDTVEGPPPGLTYTNTGGPSGCLVSVRSARGGAGGLRL